MTLPEYALSSSFPGKRTISALSPRFPIPNSPVPTISRQNRTTRVQRMPRMAHRPFGDRVRPRDDELWGFLPLHKTHPADPLDGQPGVIAVMGDLDPEPLSCLDDDRSGRDRYLPAVDGHRHQFLRWFTHGDSNRSVLSTQHSVLSSERAAPLRYVCLELLPEVLQIAFRRHRRRIAQDADRLSLHVAADILQGFEVGPPPFPLFDPLQHLVKPRGPLPALGTLAARFMVI